jgi:hypothetical protein
MYRRDLDGANCAETPRPRLLTPPIQRAHEDVIQRRYHRFHRRTAVRSRQTQNQALDAAPRAGSPGRVT